MKRSSLFVTVFLWFLATIFLSVAVSFGLTILMTRQGIVLTGEEEVLSKALSLKELGTMAATFAAGALLAAGLSRKPLFAPQAAVRGGVAMLGAAFEGGDRFVRRWPSAMLALLLIAGACVWLLVRG